jgi:citrate synthase
MFNAFKYTKQLEGVGFSREQAEIQLQVITEIVEGELATKQDLKIFESGLRQDLKSLETSLRQEMKILESNLLSVVDTRANQLELKFSGLENKFNNLGNNVQQLEYRLTIKLGTLLVIGFTTMATLLKFWIH